MNRAILRWINRSIATGLIGVGLLALESTFSSAQAAQQLFCSGQMNSGWSYTAEFLDGRFTHIRWERSGQPPQMTPLTFVANNIQGQPVYKGSLMAAVSVTLVDLSGGGVGQGSEISVGVEEWGWSRGTCGTSPNERTEAEAPLSIAMVQQSLMGVEQAPAREWLRQNNFFFTQTMDHTDTRVVERWNRDANQAIDVIIWNGQVFDVIEVR
ncbi:hypothetical protein [Egbenema bharatensis]|uniref:hypothetical protein n=1 Tax=Egbenema bharatensis TaxID=3463334 RepID=UPI003A884F2D